MYRTIFDKVVDITHHDYAGCEDKRGCDSPEDFRAMLKRDVIQDEEFAAIVQDYLRDFQDLHMGFRLVDQAQQRDVGFSVRRYHDHLYVTSSGKEENVLVGDVILSLDGTSINELSHQYKRRLMVSHPEREDWSSILLEFQTAEVKGQSGENKVIQLQTYPKGAFTPSYTLGDLGEGRLLLTLTDFWDHDAIHTLIKDNRKRLSDCRQLVIDVRVNKGGSDLAYFELLPYLFSGETVDLSEIGHKAHTNCTERNVDLRVALMDDVLAQTEDEETRRHIGVMKKELIKHRGDGFVELDLSEIEENMTLDTKPGPDHVIVLTDVFCGSSGDSFVEIVKESDKVTVVGRPTLGVNDYANVAFTTFEDRFQFWYPTSKSLAVDEGKGMSVVGIAPDVYVPWTPEHLKRDVDMDKALEVLE